MTLDIIIALVTGVVSGVISGVMVSERYKKLGEKKELLEQFNIERQIMSRRLGLIKILGEYAIREGEHREILLLALKLLFENAPLRSSFKHLTEESEKVFEKVYPTLQALETEIRKKEPDLDIVADLLKNVSHCRWLVLGLKVKV